MIFLSFAVPCPVGEFSRSGLMPCYPCPQDYYQPNPGKSFCLSCPFYGTTTITGARSITDCSSKMIILHFSSYPVLESFVYLCGNFDCEYYLFSVPLGVWMCLAVLLKVFLMTMTRCFTLGMSNLITSKFLRV